jgi:hypothetical protein
MSETTTYEPVARRHIAEHCLKSLTNSKLPDLTRDVASILVLHLPCEFAKRLGGNQE